MTSPAVSNRPRPIFAVPLEVFTDPGPVVSVYLTTEAALPQAAARVELRWKTLRARLADYGAPEIALTAVDPLIEGSHTAGETLVALAGSGGLLYTAHLPELPEGTPPPSGRCPTWCRYSPPPRHSSPTWWWSPTGSGQS